MHLEQRSEKRRSRKERQNANSSYGSRNRNEIVSKYSSLQAPVDMLSQPKLTTEDENLTNYENLQQSHYQFNLKETATTPQVDISQNQMLTSWINTPDGSDRHEMRIKTATIRSRISETDKLHREGYSPQYHRNTLSNKLAKELSVEPYPETIPEARSLIEVRSVIKFQETSDPIATVHQKRSKLPGNVETVKISERMAHKLGIEVFQAPPLPQIQSTKFVNFLSEPTVQFAGISAQSRASPSRGLRIKTSLMQPVLRTEGKSVSISPSNKHQFRGASQTNTGIGVYSKQSQKPKTPSFNVRSARTTKTSPTKIVKPEKSTQINKESKLYITLMKRQNQFNPTRQKPKISKECFSYETSKKEVNSNGIASIMAGDYIVKQSERINSGRNYGKPLPLLDLYFSDQPSTARREGELRWQRLPPRSVGKATNLSDGTEEPARQGKMITAKLMQNQLTLSPGKRLTQSYHENQSPSRSFKFTQIPLSERNFIYSSQELYFKAKNNSFT